MKSKKERIRCPTCQKPISLIKPAIFRFCPYCGNLLKKPQLETTPEQQTVELLSNRYQILESIGKGGMGEVFLAFDTICGRRMALKKIRSDLIEHPHIRHRFLKEAHITCQLTHPAIIPIYSIQSAQLSAYYTMPFVEGETLKQIIRKAKHQEKKGEKQNHTGTSIPALMRIFIQICQAVAYAHSKSVLHRDLKPENIIIGKYGEVLILDWGLAKYTQNSVLDDENIEQPIIPIPQNTDITRIGKVVGTVAYMAPERGVGNPATIQTDIYSLGVILYQLLTLRSPFKRGTLEEFRKNHSFEEWVDPVLVAPYRDVPRILSRIAKKCLDIDPNARYLSVDEIIYELENYLEGRSEWFFVAELNIKEKNQWEFQEHVLIAEHVAITRTTEEAEWVNLMISQGSFAGNIQIETTITIGESGNGIGILLNVPEPSERICINDGYCLWIGADYQRTTKLLRSNVEVMHAPDISLKRQQPTRIRIEKIDNTIHLYLNDILQFSYITHLPLIGTHVGILSRDSDFTMDLLKISVGSLNLTVNCLAVPDAFLAHRDFSQALSEYRRIAYSFPDRAEGREALFRAGLTFIEQSKGAQQKNNLLEQALQEFEKLHGTPGGPLEYLGKALVYQILNENEEEIKCFEIGYRRYPKHPLLSLMQEQILSRMHEVSRQQRLATYRFILLTVRYFSSISIDTHTRRLLASLQKHWEVLPFIEEQYSKLYSVQMRRLAIPLAFWLAKPYILGEILDDLLKMEHPTVVEIGNVLACLIQLGSYNFAKKQLEKIKNHRLLKKVSWKNIEVMLSCHEEDLKKTINLFLGNSEPQQDFSSLRTIFYLLDVALDQKKTELVHEILIRFDKLPLDFSLKLNLDIRRIWALLLEKKWKEAGEVLYSYSIEVLNEESTLLHFLYGCWLQATEGREIALIHFMGLLHVTYPRTWTLAGHELIKDPTEHNWSKRAFLWEKRELYRQLSLFHHCSGDESQSNFFFQHYKEQYINVDEE